ncbi:hypothetical protein [Bradyrhizobium sp. STM 3562]|uniref:hypothetical protein n=1 Tax=Bradyrhizobium sp. STM 3562 TaxID=578924 RepID=UPI00388F5AB1
MKWMRERDALIAQTLAFVQSVAGRKAAAGAPPPSPAPESADTGSAAPEMAQPDGTSTIASNPPVPPATDLPPLPAANARSSIADDLKTEINARVASFRAHQERFNREREEYFSATLAKLRAAIRDGAPPRPRK